MSLDHRLREGFERSAGGAGEEDVDRSLETVVAGARRRVRNRRLAAGALALAIAAIGVGAGPRVVDAITNLRQSRPASQPKPIDQVAGTYLVEVPGSERNFGGRWTVQLLRSGAMQVDAPPGIPAQSGLSFFVDETTLRTNVFGDLCPAGEPGTYRWQASPRSLTFTVVEDACDLRRAFLTSVPWIRLA